MVTGNLEAIANALHAASLPAGPDSSAAPAAGEPGAAKQKDKNKKRKSSDLEDLGTSAPSEQLAQQQNGLVHSRKHDKRKEGKKQRKADDQGRLV